MAANTSEHRAAADPRAKRAGAIGDQERLLASQDLRVREAADRLARQQDPALHAALADELRFQEQLRRGLAEGLEALRERAIAEREAARARTFLSGLEQAMAHRVEGEERRALIAEVRAKLQHRPASTP